jgi:hypothetical protein
MPWDKHKGVRIKLLSDAYLSFLTTTSILKGNYIHEYIGGSE